MLFSLAHAQASLYIIQKTTVSTHTHSLLLSEVAVAPTQTMRTRKRSHTCALHQPTTLPEVGVGVRPHCAGEIGQKIDTYYRRQICAFSPFRLPSGM